ncbi:hypothetical protein D3C74_50730 [compost metagenome]
MRLIQISIPTGFSNVLASQIQAAASSAASSTLMAAKSKWEQIAQQRLTTTRTDYLLGLNADDSIEMEAFGGSLTLRGKWPNMLESGFSAFDMKDGFGKSSKKKMKKDGGWYMTIPMRHTTPGTVGSAVGGQAMPDDIYAQARLLSGGQRLRGTEKSYPAQTSWTGYQHKSGKFEGMQRNQMDYEKVKQSAYFTFRRVSDKSDDASWKHPGFVGIKAIEEVEPWTRATFQRVLNANIKGLMG